MNARSPRSAPLDTIGLPRLRLDPLFVVGYSRSGTTLLRLMLNAHPDIAIPPESEYIPRLKAGRRLGNRLYRANELPALVRKILSLTPHADWRLEPEFLERILRAALPAKFPTVVASLYQAWAAQVGKPHARWGDKKPQHIQFAYRLRRWFPAGQFIHVIRDPRDTIASMLEYFPQNIPLRRIVPAHITLAWHWKTMIATIRRQARALSGARYYELSYEDLVAAPQRSLDDICAFLGVPFHPRMLDYQQDANNGRIGSQTPRAHKETLRPPHTGRIGRHAEILSDIERRTVEYVCADTMDGADSKCSIRISTGARALVDSYCGILHTIHRIRRAGRRMSGRL